MWVLYVYYNYAINEQILIKCSIKLHFGLYVPMKIYITCSSKETYFLNSQLEVCCWSCTNTSHEGICGSQGTAPCNLNLSTLGKTHFWKKTVRRLEWLLSLIILSNPDFVVAGKVFLTIAWTFRIHTEEKISCLFRLLSCNSSFVLSIAYSLYWPNYHSYHGNNDETEHVKWLGFMA